MTLGIWGAQTLDRYSLLFSSLALMVTKRDLVRLWGSPMLPALAIWEANMDWCMKVKELISAMGLSTKVLENVGAIQIYF